MRTSKTEIAATAALERRRILGIGADAVTLDDACRFCAEAVRSRRSCLVGAINVAKLVRLQDDVALREAVEDCELVIADGLPIVWASRLLRQPLPMRVAGIDLFLALLAQAERLEHSVYFLGATPEVLEKVIARVRRDHPQLRIAGCRNGYFATDEEAEVAAAIREANADLLFVGMSTPKKELFIQRWGRETGVPVCHGVGGSFDVYAGKLARAPQSWQRLGLEWFHRLLQEPHRLWRRYLTTNSIFAYLLMRAIVRTIREPR